MQYAKPVTLNVEECDRLSFLPYLFGNDFLYAEAYVYALAQKMMPEYQGGFWHFIRLPDGGGYMMPDGDRFHLVNGENWFDRTVSADAAGIILTSLVINRQLWLYHDSGDVGLTAQSHSLTLRDAQGETQVVRISSLDSSWSLFRPEKMPVADGERLRVTGKIPGLRVSGGDRLQVASVSEDAMTVVVPGRAEPASLPVSDSPFMALKLENGWVETPGHSVSDSAKVFASVTQMAMDNATLNGLARSGRDVRLYSSLDETRTAEKLARHPSFTVVSEQIKARAGETLLETAISLQKTGLHTPAQQAIHLALPVVESKNLAFSMVDLLTEAKSFAAEGTSFTELGGEINAQIKRGDLLYVDVAKGYGTGLLVSRASYEAEKSILRHILEGKEAVTPLMERVPGELMDKLTSGQRAARKVTGNRWPALSQPTWPCRV